MTKLDNFKKFISNHPDFIDAVRNNETTWQKLYELYEIISEFVNEKLFKNTD